MKKRDGIVWFAVLVVLVLVVVLFRDKIHFDWAMFWQQLKHANPWHIGCADGADLRDVLAAGGAVGGVCFADEEGVGGIAAGTAVHRVYGGGAVWAACGSDAALPGGAEDWICR